MFFKIKAMLWKPGIVFTCLHISSVSGLTKESWILVSVSAFALRRWVAQLKFTKNIQAHSHM